jgi:hypothetical protein
MSTGPDRGPTFPGAFRANLDGMNVINVLGAAVTVAAILLVVLLAVVPTTLDR